MDIKREHKRSTGMHVLYEKYVKREQDKSGVKRSKQMSLLDRFCMSEG
jgi:hypothetical protein